MVFNRILSLFDLKIENGKLFFEYKLKYGSIDFFILEMNEEGVRKVSEFLELPYTPWSDEKEDLYYAIANSPYFNKEVFTKHLSWRKDYNEFVELVKKNSITLYRPVFIPGYRAMVVDRFFGTDVSRKLNIIKETGYSQKEFKNKFNGHLVQKWVPELKQGKLLKETVDEFKKHIEKRFDVNFIEYLHHRPNKAVRLDFLFFYYGDLKFYEMEFDDELPF